MEIFRLTLEQITPGLTISVTKIIAMERVVSLKDFWGKLNYFKHLSQII